MRAAELHRILETLPIDRPQVVVEGERRHLLATVTSPSFAQLDDFDRQAMVWGHVREQGADVDAVEFIFTWAPGEAEAA